MKLAKSVVIAAGVGMMFIGSVSAQDNSLRMNERLDRLEDAFENLIPSGAVLAYLGAETAMPDGWEICGRGKGSSFPSLEGRFLVGTHHLSSVGQEVGSSTHNHHIDFLSSPERDGHTSRHPEGADNYTRAPNWSHKHNVSGHTAAGANIPPSIHVLFLCKQ